jgi:tetratricopeptide (TPR) repeat protein
MTNDRTRADGERRTTNDDRPTTNDQAPTTHLKPDPRFSLETYPTWLLAALALIYALLAGLRTLQEFDLGWQLASGRWVWQHHQLFSTDVFSYTAHGQPWIYPVLSGIIFYLTYLAGGYSLLSWLGAAACAGTIALLLRRGEMVTSALALIAVPLIANRTQPRAEMFSTILFAAFLGLLWRHYRNRPSPLWLLPCLMAAWVNLHLGFVAGLALCGAYLGIEGLHFPFRKAREAARLRLRRAWPWLALTVAATFANPWGASIYLALIRQGRAQSLHTSWLVEWESIRPSWMSLWQALDWRDPQSSFWWLLAAVAVSAVIALWRRQLGTAALLLAAGYFATQHIRVQGVFACLAVVAGGSVLEDARLAVKSRHDRASDSRKIPPTTKRPRWKTAGVLAATALLAALAGVRSLDLISQRYYLRSSQLSLFGSGLSWWFPERAVNFLEHEKLPANVFNSYNLGGFFLWRLPGYADYIDGRAIPFGPQLFFRAYELSVSPPESAVWRQEAGACGINTIFVSLARYGGRASFPQLQAFCRSHTWRPVYLDEVSAIFVRRTPPTEALVDRLQIDCQSISFVQPTDFGSSARSRAEVFNTLANTGGVLYSLGRYPEALASLDRAQTIFAANANLRLTRALVLGQMGRAAEAEEEFRASIQLEPSDEASLDLGLFYMEQKRFEEAAAIFRRSAESSSRPHDFWMLLGQADLQTNRPQPALDAFDKAVQSSPFGEEGESLGAGFNSIVATGRAKAWYQLGDVEKAVSFQEDAVRLAPSDGKLWLGLADLYQAQGRMAEAEQARARATAPPAPAASVGLP